jgi:hypothetical protein
MRVGAGKASLIETRRQVKNGWLQTARRLSQDGMPDLADDVRRFVSAMPPPRTNREWVTEHMRRYLPTNREPSIVRQR